MPSVDRILAATLLVPSSTDAFTVLGTSLSTNLRHFRIYDNFTDASANDNVTPDTNFPGYTGAEMAIWKGARASVQRMPRSSQFCSMAAATTRDTPMP